MTANAVESLAVLLLLTNDTERTARFYRDVLGLALAEEESFCRLRLSLSC